MQGISLRGLALGIAVMVVLDLVVAAGLSIALGGPGVSPGMTPEQIREATNAFTHTPGYLAGSLIMGVLTTAIGGYIAGRIGSVAPYLNAGLLGALGALVTVFLGRGFPPWFILGGVLAVIPAALLGGYVAARGTGSKA